MMYNPFDSGERFTYVYTKDGRRVAIDKDGNMVKNKDINQKKFKNKSTNLKTKKKKR